MFEPECELDHSRFSARIHEIASVKNTSAQSLSSSEHRLLVERSALLQSAADGIYAIDGAGNCSFVNRAFTQMLGYSAEECLGRDMHELIHAKHKDGTAYPRSECPIYRCVSSGEGTKVDDDIAWRKDGTRLTVEYSAEPIKIGQTIEGAVVTMRDVSDKRRSQDDLAASERRLRLALTAGRMGTWFLDGRTNLIHWDAALEQLYGLEPGTFDGTTDAFLSLVHPEDRDRVMEKLMMAGLAGSQYYEEEFRIVRPDGRTVWIDERGQVLIDSNGRKLGISGVCWDSTARREAEQDLRNSEARTRAVLDTALDCIISMDVSSRIIEFNPAAERTFGYKREDVIGHKLPELIIPPALRDSHYRGMQRYLKTGDGPVLGQRVEVTAMRSDGSEFPAEIAVSRISGASDPCFTAYLRDITQRRQQDEQLRAAKEAAEEANQAKSQFLASMSHELRTPLNAIIGYSEMLQEEAAELGTNAFSNDLAKIHTAGRHLLDLINNVLDLSKIEAGRMELFEETFDVCQAVTDVADTVTPLVTKNGNSLAVECPADAGQMRNDLTKLRQSLLNLLSNATKFTEGGSITLRVEPLEREGRRWFRFVVSDTGIGIEPDKLEGLFEPFLQADTSTTRNFGGTGLGLTISRRFCRLMGGDLTATSGIGEGSSFIVELPADGVPPDNPQPAAVLPLAPEVDAAPANAILIVDDNATARDLMRRTLEKEGFRTVSATNGADALELARRIHPAAITLDVMMPGMDGWSVLGQLKADRETCDIPVIMVTVLEDRSLAYSLGANDYLTKPIDRERLRTVLRKHHCGTLPCPVLVVEDNPDNRSLLRSILEREEWTVDEAANGAEALVKLGENRYELILLDLMMPTMDGFELVTALKQNTAWRATPVIVLTAKDITEQDRARLNGQVQKIISKGQLNREGLLSEIQRVVGVTDSGRTFQR